MAGTSNIHTMATGMHNQPDVQPGSRSKLLTKDLIMSVCEGDFTRFKNLVRRGADTNCDIEQYTNNCDTLKRAVPLYTVAGMSERRRPMSLLAASTIHKSPYMTRVCITKRMSTLERPMSSEDMLWVLDHSTLANFRLICRKFGESFVNGIICFERSHGITYDDGELVEPETETVRTSAVRVLINSLRVWREIDSFYESISQNKQSIQVRKLTYLIRAGGKMDYDGYVYTGGMTLLSTLIYANEIYAVDRLLLWKIVKCGTRESIIYIDVCLELYEKALVSRLLREPTMMLNINPSGPPALITHHWIINTHPLNAQQLTDIILEHNYVYQHKSVCVLTTNDTTERLTHLYNAGVDLIDPYGLLKAPFELDFTHPGLDADIVKNIIDASATPRSLLHLARLAVKTQIGPCKTGQLHIKLNKMGLPAYIKNVIADI